ncbi:GPI-anchored surface protein, putative [Bodo saltans]|uniref:Protein kish n=1 Tax=Bodo saltans TaxID=75058 RepID=A0A0S4JU30_BODSA|nr:GPI-anchored surface protein, putative [Bodo saltans]|eukprot:CUG92880.1 GPI-anchored surface protein, putative [Bodo saltans]
MSAILSFESTVFVLLLLVCTATYLRQYRPTLFHRDHTELHKKFLYKCSVVGDRLSPWVALGCFVMAIRVLFVY